MAERPPGKRLLIIVEGPSDQGFIEGLLGKLGVSPGPRIARLGKNDPLKAARIIEAFGYDADLIIVLKDQHDHPEERVKELLSRVDRNTPEDLRGKLRKIIVKRAIEAWILADPQGLRSLCSKAGFTGDPEAPENPAEILERELAKCNKQYIKTREWGRRLAREIDPRRAIQKSSSLKRFLETLRDP